MENTTTITRKRRIIYWTFTAWLSLGMLSTAIVQLTGHRQEAEMFGHLGYPLYLLALLGICKILGVIVVLIPGTPVLKEWAYAGFFFSMSGAAYSHMMCGDKAAEVFPSLLLLALTMISWYFRPGGRRLPATAR